MSNVTALHSEHANTFVTHAADEIRGLMAAKRIPGYKLPELTSTDTSRGYWQRRLNGSVPFDLADISYLALALDMPLHSLLGRIIGDFPDGNEPQDAKKAPTNKGGGQRPRQDLNLRPMDYKAAGSGELIDLFTKKVIGL